MAIYSGAVRTTQGTAANPTLEIIASSVVTPRLLELGISQAAATAGVFGFGRPAAIGVGPTSPVTVIAEDQNGPTGQTSSALAWGTTAPTVPTVFFRRVSCPNTIGAGIIWTFPRGLILQVSKTVVVWIIATAPVADIWFVLDE